MPLRRCLREPIPEIEIAARHLDRAVSAHSQGDYGAARELLRRADDPVVREWLESVWGAGSFYSRLLRRLAEPPTIPKSERARPRDATAATKALIYQRDGYYCRFCKIPVIRSKIRIAIHRLYPQEVPWGSANASQHAGFQCVWAQYDHAFAHSHGGMSDLANVFLTCAACNDGRGNFLLGEQDLTHPDLHPPRTGPWDGLERFLNRP